MKQPSLPIEIAKETLDSEIKHNMSLVQTNKYDLSFGEIINLYKNDELIIDPIYQRSFRWDKDKQTRFIDSLLLGIPIPPIFVFETAKGKWELIDGLQRVSTVLSFFGELENEEKNNLELTDAGLIKSLNGLTIKNFPFEYKMALKRSYCRVEIVKSNSDIKIQYELFSRLNTGGSILSEQEIRNCIYRKKNEKFINFINKLGQLELFQEIIEVNEEEKELMYCEELVLRYFTLKNRTENMTNIQDDMNNFIENIDKAEFDYEYEEELFLRILKIMNKLKISIFKIRGRTFSISLFDALMINFSLYIDVLEHTSNEKITEIIDSVKKDTEFKNNMGVSASSKNRINNRITISKKYFSSLTNEFN